MELFSGDCQKKVTVVETHLLQLTNAELLRSIFRFYKLSDFSSSPPRPLGKSANSRYEPRVGRKYKKEEKWGNMEIGDNVDKKT